MSGENMVVIDEPEIIEQKPEALTEESLREEGTSDYQIELAKKHGLIKEPEKKEDGEHQEQPEVKAEAGKSEEKEELDIEALDSFEKVHELFEQKPEQFRTLPNYLKAQYHNAKGLYKRAKEESEKRREVEQERDFLKVQDKGAMVRLSKIREALSNPDELTVEQLQALVGEAEQIQDGQKTETPETKELAARRAQDALQSRVNDLTKFGQANYDNFIELIEMADEVAKQNTFYGQIFQQALQDVNVTEHQLAKIIEDTARLNPNYGKAKTNGKAENNTNTSENIADRITKNANKRTSSAAIGGGRGRRVISHDDLTPEDAANMSYAEYKKLPEETRKRLLMG